MGNTNEKHITPLKAIRLHCLDCSCGSSYEVAHCPCVKCDLYEYRFGKNPNRKGIGNKSPKGVMMNLAKDFDDDGG